MWELKFANPADEARFKRGPLVTLPHGPQKAKQAGVVVVTKVDRNRGIIEVSARK